jgi:hypothetical protein
MKVPPVDPVLALQRERRGRNQEEKAKTLIEKRREYFKNNLAKSLQKRTQIDISL